MLKIPNIDVILADADGNTALILAIKHEQENGQSEVIQALLSASGINVNAINKQGETAIKIAHKKGYMDIVQILEQYVNIK